jgi:hypothetical protein
MNSATISGYRLGIDFVRYLCHNLIQYLWDIVIAGIQPLHVFGGTSKLYGSGGVWL